MKMIIAGIAAVWLCACAKPADEQTASSESRRVPQTDQQTAVQPRELSSFADKPGMAATAPVEDTLGAQSMSIAAATGAAVVIIENSSSRMAQERYADKITRFVPDPEREKRNAEYSTEPREKYAEGYNRPVTGGTVRAATGADTTNEAEPAK